MSDPSVKLEEYVYRRLTPSRFKKGNRSFTVADDFYISEGMRGMSMYMADMISPHQLIQKVIDDKEKKLLSCDTSEKLRINNWKEKNPNVKCMIEKGWRLVQIPIAEIKKLGLTNFEGPDPDGHINILGTYDQFKHIADEFVALIDNNIAYVLSDEESMSMSSFIPHQQNEDI